MRILFITSNRVGDAVLSTGLLDHLLQRFPTARFTIACGPVAAELFARMPRAERVIAFEKRRFGLHWLGLWGRCAGGFWDLVVDNRGSMLGFFLLHRRQARLRRRRGPKIAEIGAILGLDPPPLPVVWTAPEDRALAARLLPSGPPIIALGPTANWSGKIWPAERFAELFSALSESLLPGARAAVFAGPGAAERAMAAPLLARLPGAIDLCGRLTLHEAAACLGRAALYIGNDSGLMHLAAAAGTPTLGLFGPTQAAEYAPAGRAARAVVASGPDMADLSVAAALRAATALLAQAQAA